MSTALLSVLILRDEFSYEIANDGEFDIVMRSRLAEELSVLNLRGGGVYQMAKDGATIG